MISGRNRRYLWALFFSSDRGSDQPNRRWQGTAPRPCRSCRKVNPHPLAPRPSGLFGRRSQPRRNRPNISRKYLSFHCCRSLKFSVGRPTACYEMSSTLLLRKECLAARHCALRLRRLRPSPTCGGYPAIQLWEAKPFACYFGTYSSRAKRASLSVHTPALSKPAPFARASNPSWVYL